MKVEIGSRELKLQPDTRAEECLTALFGKAATTPSRGELSRWNLLFWCATSLLEPKPGDEQAAKRALRAIRLNESDVQHALRILNFYLSYFSELSVEKPGREGTKDTTGDDEESKLVERLLATVSRCLKDELREIDAAFDDLDVEQVRKELESRVGCLPGSVGWKSSATILDALASSCNALPTERSDADRRGKYRQAMSAVLRRDMADAYRSFERWFESGPTGRQQPPVFRSEWDANLTKLTDATLQELNDFMDERLRNTGIEPDAPTVFARLCELLDAFSYSSQKRSSTEAGPNASHASDFVSRLAIYVRDSPIQTAPSVLSTDVVGYFSTIRR